MTHDPLVDSTRAREHITALIDRHPYLTPHRIGVLAGSWHGATQGILEGRRIRKSTEDLILAVTDDYAPHGASRGTLIPPDRARAHVRGLLAVPYATVHTLRRVTGVDEATIDSLVRGTYPGLTVGVATRLLRCTRADVEAAVAYADPEPTVLRIRALARMGYPYAVVAAETGLSRAVVAPIARRARIRLTIPVRDAVAEAYERLRDTPGPSPATRAWAEREGFLGPDEFDEDMSPIDGDRYWRQMECRCLLRQLALSITGYTATAAAKVVEVDRRTVERTRSKVGLRVDAHGEVRPGQETLIALIAAAVAGIEVRERIEVLDDPDTDYTARWEALTAAAEEDAASRKAAEQAAERKAAERDAA